MRRGGTRVEQVPRVPPASTTTFKHFKIGQQVGLLRALG